MPVGKGRLSIVRLPLLLVKELMVLLFVLVVALSLKTVGLTAFSPLRGLFCSKLESGIEKSKAGSSRYVKGSIEEPKLAQSAEVVCSVGDVVVAGSIRAAKKSGQSWLGKGVVREEA